MPRPKKCRRVCGLPKRRRFGPMEPLESASQVCLLVEEYETLRLMDWEGLTQQECGEMMGVARTTVQAIYDSARRKVADCLVNGKTLLIEGGHYQICARTMEDGCPKESRLCKKCCGRRNLL